MTEQKKILRIEDDIASINNGQIAIEPTVDATLGYKMWGGKDYSGTVSRWLAKDQNARVDDLTALSLAGVGAGLVRHDNAGLLSGGEISTSDLSDLLSDGPLARIEDVTLQEAYENGNTITLVEEKNLLIEVTLASFQVDVGGSRVFEIFGDSGGGLVFSNDSGTSYLSVTATSLQDFDIDAEDITLSATNFFMQDRYLTSAISLSSVGNATFSTTDQSIVGAVNELESAIGSIESDISDIEDALTNRTQREVTSATLTIEVTETAQTIFLNRAGVIATTFSSAWIADTGRRITFKDSGFNADIYNHSFATEGAETIDGETSVDMVLRGRALTFETDGSNVYLV